jgi:hypothetical protein
MGRSKISREPGLTLRCDCGTFLWLCLEQWPGFIDGTAPLEDHPCCPSCAGLFVLSNRVEAEASPEERR